MKDLLELAKKVAKPGFDFLAAVMTLQSIYGNMQDDSALIGFQKIVTLLYKNCASERKVLIDGSRRFRQPSQRVDHRRDCTS